MGINQCQPAFAENLLDHIGFNRTVFGFADDKQAAKLI